MVYYFILLYNDNSVINLQCISIMRLSFHKKIDCLHHQLSYFMVAEASQVDHMSRIFLVEIGSKISTSQQQDVYTYLLPIFLLLCVSL